MTKARRINYWPDEFIVGVSDLKPDEIGCYWMVCSLMYSRGGPIPDDDQWIARVCNCSVRTWRAIKARLVTLGKIQVEISTSSAPVQGFFGTLTEGGWLLNRRALRELEGAFDRINKNRENGERGGRPPSQSNENNTQAKANGSRDSKPTERPTRANQLSTINHQPITSNQEEEREGGADAPARPSLPAAPPQPVEPDLDLTPPVALDRNLDEAVRRWNAMAERCGLARVALLSEPRRVALRRRLVECGGLSGWDTALERVAGSPFLTGDNDRGWKIDFDTLIKPAKFIKLMEGGYDRREGQAKKTSGHDAFTAAADDVLAAIRERGAA